MNCLESGIFFGETSKTINLDGITLTETLYIHSEVDWHYHRNSHFSFILNGSISEETMNSQYDCPAGMLVYHPSEKPHRNFKSNESTTGFHIEMHPSWFANYYINQNDFDNISTIKEPFVRLLFHRLYKETKIPHELSISKVDELLIQVFTSLQSISVYKSKRSAAFRSELKNLISNTPVQQLSLKYLSDQLNMHPVHISRSISKNFNCTLGQLKRQIKVEKSLILMRKNKLSLTQIAFECGFADQSHFLRSFKEIALLTPSEYRKILN